MSKQKNGPWKTGGSSQSWTHSHLDESNIQKSKNLKQVDQKLTLKVSIPQ